MAETRIQTVKDLASSRFDWEQALRDISRAVPADVTLRELNGTISDAPRAAPAAASAARSPRPRSSSRAARAGQKQVATLLARLRNVDGVTRVSLSKSTKPEASQTVGAASPIAGGADAVGCTGKRPPNFEIVMFFEGAEVPATVEDVTVQPAPPSRAPAAPTPRPTRRSRRTRAAPRRTRRRAATAPPRPPRPPREGQPSDPLEQDPAVGGRARRRHRRLLLLRPLAQARGGRQVRQRDRDPGGRDRAGAPHARRLRGGARRPTRRNYATLARLGKAVPTDDDVALADGPARGHRRSQRRRTSRTSSSATARR